MEFRFDGAIAGVGTSSGTRLVSGIWPSSPFGPVADVMIERPGGHRILLAPSQDLADFVAATYRFDEVRVEHVDLAVKNDRWTLRAPSLRLEFDRGRRTALGWALGLVPRPLARSRTWCRALDPMARVVRPGVRTAGTAGNGRREYYGALDEHALVRATAVLDGVELGPLAPLRPPVRFGFGSAPARPSLVRVTTLIDA